MTHVPPGSGFASVSQPAGFGAPPTHPGMAPAGYNPQYVGMNPSNVTLYQGGFVPPQQGQPQMAPQSAYGTAAGPAAPPPSYEESK